MISKNKISNKKKKRRKKGYYAFVLTVLTQMFSLPISTPCNHGIDFIVSLLRNRGCIRRSMANNCSDSQKCTPIFGKEGERKEARKEGGRSEGKRGEGRGREGITKRIMANKITDSNITAV
jgi:hypothetical protein